MIGCEIHFKRENKEPQLLSTEKQDKAKVTAVIPSLTLNTQIYALTLTLVI